MALQGTKALEAWCRKVTQGYEHINILNMTTSWRSGLGFCAIIHHFCPELIDYACLDPDDVFGNNELAFSTAEQHLGIPSLLDPQDMVECELLDRLSILTYLSQYFQAFNSQAVQSRVRVLGSVSKSSSTSSDLASSDLLSGQKTKLNPRIGRLNDPCKQCGKSVFILERLNVGGRIVHRTCFKCARCETQLSLASYYETETTGQFCCEVCPDEEKKEARTLRSNKDLAKEVSVDSGHSTEEDEKEEEEKETDLSVTSGYAGLESGASELSCHLAGATDVNDNLENNNMLSLSETVGCEIESQEINRNEENLEKVCVEDQFIHCEKQIETEIDDTCEHQVDNVAVAFQACDLEDNELSPNTNEADITTINDSYDQIDAPKIETVDISVQSSHSENKITNAETDYPDDMNPFGDESQEADPDQPAEITNKAIEEEKPVVPSDPPIQNSGNPFGSDLESEEEETAVNKAEPPINPTSSNLVTPHPSKLSLNPFGSDLSSDEELPVPPSPSLSTRSSVGRARKKRPAPLPPTPGGPFLPTPAPRLSLHRADRQSPSPARRKAPAPPAETAKRMKDQDNLHRRSQILESIHGTASPVSPTPAPIPEDPVVSPGDSCITSSDTVSLVSSITTQSSQLSVSMFSNLGPDKAEEGQWRKKKGPAPPRPIPPKRTVKKLARKVINQELFDIEVKQGELERQGVKLEKTIREICAADDAEEGADRDSLGPEAEDLIIQLFDLVNEKNELFRRQTELIYMKKENRLEEQHADCEYQIRVLMSKPEHHRTDEDQKREEKLIARLVEIVGLRNEIVDCLEMDRLRELDEDNAIEDHMSNYAAVKPIESSKKGFDKILKRKKKKKKEKYSEKDIDTSEVNDVDENTQTKPKKKSARKKLLSLKNVASKKLAFPHKD